MAFKLTALVFVAALVGINARPHSESETFDCTGKPDGYYPDITNIQSYFSCLDGNLMGNMHCEEGSQFDGVDKCISVDHEIATLDKTVYEDNDSLSYDLPQINPPSEGDEHGNEDDDDYGNGNNTHVQGMSKKKIYNIEITKNIFPKSIVIIGKANREQKNK